jgi:hypothetical protein
MDDLVRVAIVQNEPEAELAIGLLKTEGIRAMWRPTNFAAGGVSGGWVTGEIGPVEVLVRPEDAERAKELLEPVE